MIEWVISYLKFFVLSVLFCFWSAVIWEVLVYLFWFTINQRGETVLHFIVTQLIFAAVAAALVMWWGVRYVKKSDREIQEKREKFYRDEADDPASRYDRESRGG